MKKMLILTAFSFVVGPFLCSCNNADEGPNYERWAGLEYRLVSEPVFPDRDLLMAERMIHTQDHIIIKHPFYNDGREYAVFHVKGDSLLYDGGFLSHGRGPLEVLGEYVDYIPQQNSIVVTGHNPVGRSIVIPVDDITNLFTHDKWRVYEYGEVTPEIAFFTKAIDTVSYIMPIHNDADRMFAVVDVRKPQRLIPLDVDYPDDMYVTDLWQKLMQGYGGTLPLPRPGHREQFAYTLGNGIYMAICAMDGDMKVVERKLVFNDPPKLTVRNGVAKPSGKEMNGLYMVVSEDYIYLRDNEITLEDYFSTEARKRRGYPGSYGKTIYVCDWNGDPVAKYELDRAIAYISVDEEDGWLYAFAFNPETLEDELVRFKLPHLIN